MKILFASSSSGSRGGGELYLIYLGEALAKRGHEVLLWASTHPRMNELATRFSHFGRVIRATYTNTYDYRLRCLATCLNFGVSQAAAAEWAKERPDLVHVNKQNLEDGLDLLRAADATDLPTVCTIHLTQSARYLKAVGAPLRDAVASQALRQYQGTFIAIQENRANEIKTMTKGGGSIVSIFNGVPLQDVAALRLAHRSKVRRELGIPDSAILLCGLGRMVAQKRPLLFLEHAQQVLAADPDIRFLWIGDGTLSAEWDRFVGDMQLEGRVIRVPWQADPNPYLAASDAFLHVAEYESFVPLAMLEAMTMNLAPIVSQNLIDDIPLLQSAQDWSIPICDGWVEQATTRGLLETLGARARKVVEDDFSMDRVAARYEQLYQQQWGRKNGKGRPEAK